MAFVGDMDFLLSLYISCITPENYLAEYHIGLFTSTEEVDTVIKRLTSDGGKFFKSHCKARIEKIKVVGENQNIECVYRFYGQNIDSSADGDIIESPCFVDKSVAVEELMKAKRETPRQKWNLETHIIGKSNW